MHQEYRESFRNHDDLSGFLTTEGSSSGAGETHLSGMKINQEHAGLETNLRKFPGFLTVLHCG